MKEVQECDLCGRELPSHHLGCAGAKAPVYKGEATNGAYDLIPRLDEFYEEDESPEKVAELVTAFDSEQVTCAATGCQDEPKPYGGRGPRPKFCAAHSAGKGK